MSNRLNPERRSIREQRRSIRERRARLLLAPLGFAGVALIVAACGSTTASSVSVPKPAVVASSTASGTVLGSAKTPLGTILVDAQGRTVYEFASDSKDTSTCTAQCLSYWPPVKAPSTLPGTISGVTGTVGSFARPDGGTQLTINGLPLYTYAADTAPGMTTGQGSTGSGAKWWVVAPDGTPITTTPPVGSAGPAAPAPAGTASSTGSGY
jgi:predicted lipoprotein with Yx(FWY)xxD motif